MPYFRGFLASLTGRVGTVKCFTPSVRGSIGVLHVQQISRTSTAASHSFWVEIIQDARFSSSHSSCSTLMSAQFSGVDHKAGLGQPLSGLRQEARVRVDGAYLSMCWNVLKQARKVDVRTAILFAHKCPSTLSCYLKV